MSRLLEKVVSLLAGVAGLFISVFWVFISYWELVAPDEWEELVAILSLVFGLLLFASSLGSMIFSLSVTRKRGKKIAGMLLLGTGLIGLVQSVFNPQFIILWIVPGVLFFLSGFILFKRAEAS